jgi:hypothetical protein
VLLTIRGAILHNDWNRPIDGNRLLAVTIGAAAYGLVLRQLQAGHRITLRGAVAWIVSATLAVMVVRVAIDEMAFDVPQGIGINLLWSLTWSAYFGLWVMASLAFAPTGSAPAVSLRPVQPAKAVDGKPVELDNLELMVVAIIAEAAELKAGDRAELAARVLALGGYESVEGPARDNERARLALRIAARLSAKS